MTLAIQWTIVRLSMFGKEGSKVFLNRHTPPEAEYPSYVKDDLGFQLSLE